MSAQLQQVFISYQREDEAFARQVREHLTANGVKTWMDQYDIAVGSYWTDEIDKGLAASDVVVGVLSPDSVESRNVKNEWDWAIQNGKRLVLLQVKPCVIPHRYVSINFIDATRDAEMAVQQLAAVLARQDAFVALPLAGAVVRTHAPASPAVDEATLAVDVPADAPDEPFVGRERELAQARSALDAVLAGKRQLLLLAGEPGIGKTRLAQQLTREARGRGARVFWGHCYEWEGAPPYWPWIELLRAYAESLEPTELRRQLGAGAPFVVQIVSELAVMLPGLPVLPPMNPEQARFRLFDAVARFVQQAAGQGPLVLVLDDLHWADEPSLLMLEFIARELRDLPLLLIGAYRDVEVRRDHPLARSLATLARAAEPLRIGLRGLAQAEVAAYLRDVTGSEPPDALVSAVHDGTEGNPFFVSEVVRLLQGEGRLADTAGDASWDLSIPESVRDVVGRRLDRLSPGCNELLKTGAVIGREFTLELLARIHGQPEDALLDPLDEAVEARVAEQPGAFGRYRFSHALIQATLYDELSTSQRVRLHSQVGRAIEEAQAANLAPVYGELARHFARSPVGGNLAKAIDYAVKAGQMALQQVAWESAAEHFAQAVELLEAQPGADPIRHCELLLLLGDAQNRAAAGHRDAGQVIVGAGRSPLAEQTFDRAAHAARAASSPELLARAALGLAGMNPASEQGGAAAVAVLHEALHALPGHDSILRARLLTALGTRLPAIADMTSFTVERVQRSIQLQREAIDVARRVDDPETLAGALATFGFFVAWYPDDNLAFLSEAIELAEANGLAMQLAFASAVRSLSLLGQGDLVASDSELRRLEHTVSQLRMPLYQWWVTCLRGGEALRAGALTDAERLINQALAIQPNSGVPRVQRFTLLREQERLGEIIDDFRVGWYDRFQRQWGTPAHEAVAELEFGRQDLARSAYEQGFTDAMTMAAVGRVVAPTGGLPLRAFGLLAEVCAALNDEPRVDPLYTVLLRFAGKPTFDGILDFTGAAVDYYLGLLATTAGRWDDAERHFADSLRLHESWGWRLYIPWTQYGWASMLALRSLGADRHQALDLLDRALALAGEIGMTKLIRLATALRQQLLEAR